MEYNYRSQNTLYKLLRYRYMCFQVLHSSQDGYDNIYRRFKRKLERVLLSIDRRTNRTHFILVLEILLAVSLEKWEQKLIERWPGERRGKG